MEERRGCVGEVCKEGGVEGTRGCGGKEGVWRGGGVERRVCGRRECIGRRGV